jgi:hypothetical protein
MIDCFMEGCHFCLHDGFSAGAGKGVGKTIFIPPPPSENDIFFPSRDMSFFNSHHGLFALILPYFFQLFYPFTSPIQLPSWSFCLNSALFCIYFTLLLPLFSFSFPLIPFSFPFLPFSFTFSPFFSSSFHIFSPK